MTSSTGEQPQTRSAIEPSQVELILAQIDSLPTLSPVATQLLEMTMDERAHARDLIRLIESDQTLAARILSLVRRANRVADTDSVERAVVLLGFDVVRNLACSIQIFETFSGRIEDESPHFDSQGFWKHSLAAGCAAQLLASHKLVKGQSLTTNTPKPTEAFLCGLMHDIGKVVLAACYPKTYDRVCEKADVCLSNIADAERELFGLDHTEAGRRLAAHWKLPAMVAESIWLHHHVPSLTPTQIGYPDHVRLVQLADDLVRQMRIGYSGNHQLPGDWLEALLQTDDAKAKMRDLKTELIELVEERAELIGLHSLSTKEVYEEALARANAELAQTNKHLAQTNRQLAQRAEDFEALRVFKAHLTEDPSHEDICRAACLAAKAIEQGDTVAVLGYSRSRSLVALAALRSDDESVRLEVLSAASQGDWEPLDRLNSDFGPVSMLKGPLHDRLADLLGQPPVACRPIVCQGRFFGAIIACNEPRSVQREAFEVLCDWVGSWLYGAESRTVAGKLNEELAQINRRLVDSQAEVTRMRSLAMVGEMAAGAAHELNNPLAVISGRAQLVQQGEIDEQIRRAAEVISENAHRASTIVTELMEYAKPTRPEPTVWPTEQLLGEIRQSWLDKNAIPEKQFLLIVSDDLPKIRADATQMRKLFDEIIRNAIEAMRFTPNPLLIVNCRGDVADDMVVVKIEDNGVGMTADVLERAMDPFFSSRPAGRGRGLGLSRAVRYAQINGGRIRLSSRPNEGTAVLVSLPVVCED